MAAPTPTDAPLVSAIVPTYNAGPYIAETLDSVLAQDYRPIEVLVGDDGSCDDTPQVLARYAQRYGDRIRVLRFDRVGEGGCRNRLIRASSGELIANLDGDDAWLPGKVARQVEALRANPGASLCHTGTVMFGTESGDGPALASERAQLQGSCLDYLFQHNRILPSAAMWRRKMMPASLFYEDLKYGADVGFFLQMLVQHTAVYLPEVLVRYRRHANQLSADRGARGQVYVGLARLRLFDTHGDQLDPAWAARMKPWALQELETCAYSRYWKGDYRAAMVGFSVLKKYGRTVPLKHRLKAALAARLRRGAGRR